jgi:hypothetical protein
LAGIASAAVNNPGAPYDIYVSGSTAYRSQVVSAEIVVAQAGLTSANGFGSNTVGSADSGTGGVTSDSISTIHGVDSANNEIVFHNHFTGSVAGMVDLGTNNTTLTYISDTNTPAIGTAASSVTVDTTHAPEVAMCDCAAADSATVLASTGVNAAGKTASAAITAAGPVNGGTINGGSNGFVGSVDFYWVAGSLSGSPTAGTLNNITQDQAQVLISTGQIPASFVTGNSTDGASALIYVGRNEDSGTRVAYQAEAWAYGTGNKSGLGASTKQWFVTQSGVALPQNASYSSLSGVSAGITSIQLWPRFNWNGSNYTTSSAGGWALNTESGITWSTLGHSGYNGGGDVAAILESPNPVTATGGLGGLSNLGNSPVTGAAYTGAYLVTCIGSHDGAGILTNTHGANGTPLSYNGVAYSKGNIENGTYALWNFEHLYYLTNSQGNSLTQVTNGSFIQADADALADGLYNGTFGTSSTDVGIAGNILVGFPAMLNRGATAGSYIH